MGMKDEMKDKARQAKEKMEQTRKGQRQTGQSSQSGQPGQPGQEGKPGQEGQQGRRRPGQEETPTRGRSREDADTQRAMRDEEDRLNQDYDI